MRELLSQNKDVILNFSLAGILIAMILGLGLSHIGTGAGSLVRNTEHENFADAAQLKTVAVIPKPVIKCREEKQWENGTAVIVSQAFRATDATGQELEIKVLQIRNEAGTDSTELYQESTDEIIFTEAGCYYFKLRTMDSNKKVTTEEIPLIIDSAG